MGDLPSVFILRFLNDSRILVLLPCLVHLKGQGNQVTCYQQGPYTLDPVEIVILIQTIHTGIGKEHYAGDPALADLYKGCKEYNQQIIDPDIGEHIQKLPNPKKIRKHIGDMTGQKHRHQYNKIKHRTG